MIEYETVRETGDQTIYDRLTALLIGLLAVLAASLVLVQVIEGQREARANAARARLAAEISSRISASTDLLTFRARTLQLATQVGIEGLARQIVPLDTGDEGEAAIGEAEYTASDQLLAIAMRMGNPPDTSDGLDPYVVEIMSTDEDALTRIGAEQNAAADEAAVAGRRSNQAVLGLSVIALSGVLVGLAAVLGGGRAGKALLLLAWIAAALGFGSLLLAAGLAAGPF